MGGCVALIVAAGRGRRLGGELPKQYLDLGGRVVLRHALAAYAAHPQIDAVRVVIHPGDLPLYEQAATGLHLLDPVGGGATRQDSVRLGLESLAAMAPATVLIHDGARPFVEAGLIARVVAALADHPGAVPALALADTLKRGGADGVIAATVARTGLWRAQTPQGFRFAELLAAHRAAAGLDLTDDAAAMERAGVPVALVAGSEDNVKITTADDLARARRRCGGPGEMRIGSGYDVHRFVPGAAVTLCGIVIPHDRALEGHSDADVALHALTDALLGAIAAGDIGRHFPPSDPRWRGAPSHLFVDHAAALLGALGGSVVNVDLTIVCERPRIGPHRPAMTARVAELLAIDPGRISIKATTTEGLGFTGRGEGLAVQAAVLVRLPG